MKNTRAAINNKPATATPTPTPAFAPLEREFGLDVGVGKGVEELVDRAVVLLLVVETKSVFCHRISTP